MRKRTLGAVCATCAVTVPAADAAAAEPPTVRPIAGPGILRQGLEPDMLRAGRDPLVIEYVKAARSHTGLRGERLSLAERRVLWHELARLHPKRLQHSTRALRTDVRQLRLRLERKERRERHRERTGGAPNVAIPGALTAIRACESGGNYGAVSPGGDYRGAYQFDYGTWAAVGGSGDPAAAPAAEQDRRAAMLYSRAGASPWPVCGR